MTNPVAHPTADELSAFSLGRLRAEEAASVEDHINRCEPCCETLLNLGADDTFVGILQQAQRSPPQPTAGLISSGDSAPRSSTPAAGAERTSPAPISAFWEPRVPRDDLSF